jgi:hypothetical protein
METAMKSWTVTLDTDSETGDVVLPLTDEMIADIGWEVGDTLEWIDNHDGSWTLRLKKKNLLTRLTKYLTILRTYFTRSK